MADKPRSWVSDFPGFATLGAVIGNRLVRDSRIVHNPAGTRNFGPGQSPSNFLLLRQETVLVRQVSETGREIVLYRVSAGESCALTTACLMGYDDYSAEGIAEADVDAVAHPSHLLGAREIMLRSAKTAVARNTVRT